MGSVEDDGVHVHDACTNCGVVEAEEGGLCPECAGERVTKGSDEAPAAAEVAP